MLCSIEGPHAYLPIADPRPLGHNIEADTMKTSAGGVYGSNGDADNEDLKDKI